MRRRELLQMLGAVCAAPLDAAPGAPNVLLFISDQLYHSASGVAGNPVIKTPNIDRLAKEGVRFSHAVCPTPFCNPSRASMLTGLYPHKHRITYNVGDPDRGLDPRIPSIQQILFQDGYRCGQKGKWHLGDKTRFPAYANDPELDYAEYLSKVMPNAGADGRGRRRRGRTITMTDVVRKALERYQRERGVSIGRSDVPIENTQESSIADTAIRQM